MFSTTLWKLSLCQGVFRNHNGKGQVDSQDNGIFLDYFTLRPLVKVGDGLMAAQLPLETNLVHFTDYCCCRKYLLHGFSSLAFYGKPAQGWGGTETGHCSFPSVKQHVGKPPGLGLLHVCSAGQSVWLRMCTFWQANYVSETKHSQKKGQNLHPFSATCSQWGEICCRKTPLNEQNPSKAFRAGDIHIPIRLQTQQLGSISNIKERILPKSFCCFLERKEILNLDSPEAGLT